MDMLTSWGKFIKLNTHVQQFMCSPMRMCGHKARQLLVCCTPACSFGWWLVLICSERKVLIAGLFWEKKYCWLVADKLNEQGVCGKGAACPHHARTTMPNNTVWCRPAGASAGLEEILEWDPPPAAAPAGLARQLPRQCMRRGNHKHSHHCTPPWQIWRAGCRCATKAICRARERDAVKKVIRCK
jgi:hypothetical protein